MRKSRFMMRASLSFGQRMRKRVSRDTGGVGGVLHRLYA